MTTGLVVSLTRRNARVHLDTGGSSTVRIGSRLDVVVGDRVEIDPSEGGGIIKTVKTRKNCLSRSYEGKTKRLASNLDHVFIVTAIEPTLNTIFIDRVLAASFHEEIPSTLIFNKSDLNASEAEPFLSAYEAIGVGIIRTSTKDRDGLEPLKERLLDPNLKIAALCGISGVGKSSILNVLIPGADIKTSEISSRARIGKQTTSQAVAYPYERTGLPDLYIIDLPGLQHFGVVHLSVLDLGASFPEIAVVRESCQFQDCTHVSEPSCAVQAAVERGLIAVHRFESYLHMLDEIQSQPKY